MCDHRKTRFLKLGESEQQQLGIPAAANWGSVQVSYASDDGDLVALAASLSADGKYLVQTPFTDALSYHWKGGEWMADADHNALITAGNAGSKPVRLDFKVGYGDGSGFYELPLRTLQPGEAVTVDVGKIIATQQPDRHGKTIPPSVMSGTYEFSDLDDPGRGYLYEGKQQVDKTYGHATYGCALCCYVDYAWITDFAGKVGDSGPIPAMGEQDCQGDILDIDITHNTTNWASGNPSVATVTPDWVNAVGAGATFSSGTSDVRTHYSYKSCPLGNFYPEGDISVNPVQIPTASRITTTLLSFALTGGSGCPAGQAGWYRQVEKIVTDQHGPDIVLGGQHLSETVTVGRNDLNLGTPQTGNATTNSSGRFQDIFFDCSALCPGNGETDASQTIGDTLPGGAGPYGLIPNSLVYKCTSITINGQ